jgi:hypothetical protein
MAVPIKIAYDTVLKGSGFEALCRVYVGSLGRMVEIAPGFPQEIFLEEKAFYEDSIPVRFFIGFIGESKGEFTELSAVASVFQPQEITLDQRDRWRVTGTIITTQLRALSASPVKRNCDLRCEPPANESVGIGGCVVCHLGRGIFELCC